MGIMFVDTGSTNVNVMYTAKCKLNRRRRLLGYMHIYKKKLKIR